MYILLHIKKHYFMYFCYFIYFKSSKAFSVFLIKIWSICRFNNPQIFCFNITDWIKKNYVSFCYSSVGYRGLFVLNHKRNKLCLSEVIYSKILTKSSPEFSSWSPAFINFNTVLTTFTHHLLARKIMRTDIQLIWGKTLEKHCLISFSESFGIPIMKKL